MLSQVGFLFGFKSAKSLKNPLLGYRAVPMHYALREAGVRLLMYSPLELNPDEGTVNGYVIENDRLQKLEAPVPGVNGNWFNGWLSRRHREPLDRFRHWAKASGVEIYPPTSFTRLLNDKFESYLAINDIDPALHPYTELYDGSEVQLNRFLDLGPKVFLKPRRGGKGDGVIVLDAGESGYALNHYLNQQQTHTHWSARKDALEGIARLAGNTAYIIQHGYRLARYQDAAFILRTILIDDGDQYHWIHKAVLAPPGSEVANTTQDGTNFTMLDLLTKAYDVTTAERLIHDTRRLSFDTTHGLDRLYPGELMEVAYDFVIDHEHQVKIIEVNTKPGMTKPGLSKDSFRDILHRNPEEDELYQRAVVPHSTLLARYLHSKLERRRRREAGVDAVSGVERAKPSITLQSDIAILARPKEGDPDYSLTVSHVRAHRDRVGNTGLDAGGFARSKDFVQALSEFRAGQVWNSARSERRRMNRALLHRSFALGTRFLIANQLAEGNFNYQYDWLTGAYEEGDNQIRQAGVLWGLGLAQRDYPQDETREALDKGLRFWFERTESGPEGSLLLRYGSDSSTSTGTVALVSLAIIEYLRSDEVSDGLRGELEEKLSGYLKFLQWMQLETGHFSDKYYLKTGAKREHSSPYYDGETLLCLCKAVRYLGRDELMATVELAAGSMARTYTFDAWRDDPDSSRTKGFYQWGSMAYAEYHGAGWKDAEVYADVTLALGWWMIHIHHTLKRRRNHAYAIEGLVSAYQIARRRGDGAAIRDLGYVIDRSLYKLTGWQIGGPLQETNDFLMSTPTSDAMALGGVMNSRKAYPGVKRTSGDTQHELRMDVTQHQMHAVMLALQHVYRVQPGSETIPLVNVVSRYESPETTVGFLYSFNKGDALKDPTAAFRAVPMQEALREHGVRLLMYTPRHADFPKGVVTGQVIEGDRLVEVKAPFPVVNGNWHNGWFGQRSGEACRAFSLWATEREVPMYPPLAFVKLLNDKHDSGQLMNDLHPSLHPYTELYDGTDEQLSRFFDLNSKIFIKPRRGGQGNGIIIVDSEDSGYAVSYYEGKRHQRNSFTDREDVLDHVGELLGGSGVIQHGLRLASYQQATFILRVIAINDGERYQMIHKAVLAPPGGEVANTTQGGINFTMDDLLTRVYGRTDAEAIIDKVRRISCDLTRSFDRLYPRQLMEVGYDFVIDHEHEVKCIEPNTLPGMIKPGLTKKSFIDILHRTPEEEDVYTRLVKPHGTYLAEFLHAKLRERTGGAAIASSPA